MTRSVIERLADILAAIDRCRTFRDLLDNTEFGSMAYDARARILSS